MKTESAVVRVVINRLAYHEWFFLEAGSKFINAVCYRRLGLPFVRIFPDMSGILALGQLPFVARSSLTKSDLFLGL